MTYSTQTSRHHLQRRPFLVALFIVAALGTVGCQELGELDPTQVEVSEFGSCSDVESYVKQEALTSTRRMRTAQTTGSKYDPFGYTNLAAEGTTTGDYSLTNNQEAGVDEADIFQVDRTHAFALDNGRLIIIEAVGQPAADGGILQVDDARIVADVALDGIGIEMFLKGNKVVVIQRVTHRDVALQYEVAAQLPARHDSDTVVQATVYDVADRRNPRKIRDVAVEGEYIASRRVNDRLYMVARAGLGGAKLLTEAPDDNSADWAQSQFDVISQASLDAWLPYSYTRSYTGQLATTSANRVNCASVYTAQTATGDDALGIYSFDIEEALGAVDTTTFIGDGTLVYGSTESLIVAHTNFAETTYDGGDTEEVQATALHRFSLDADTGAEYWASGLVHGWILNQFSISEYEGYIRVATQMNRETTGFKPINVFTMPIEPQPVTGVLAEEGAESEDGPATEKMYMKVAGELVDIAHGEDLFAVRFKGDKGYVVTWELVKGDPLFTIDLKNQNLPEIRGALEIPGFSTYLHPIENDHLLAIGRDTAENSVKVSLYDVGNFGDPEALHEMAVGDSGSDSEALEEHRAFRYIPEHRLMAVPLTNGSNKSMNVYRVDSSRLSQVASINHDGAEMRRTYHINGHLYVMSEKGVSIVSLNGFDSRATVNF